MKSYNHLWEKVVDPENIKLAIRNAAKGKRKRKRVKKMLENTDLYVPYFQDLAARYKHRHKVPKKIYDGICKKQREIIVPSLDEQVLHHMMVNVLQPIITYGMYEFAYGSIPGRGPVDAKNQIKRWIAHNPKKCKYVAKWDIKSFFGSIPHDKLLVFIRERIHDEKFMRLLEEIIACTDVGLPLGFHTSHWLANWYLQGLDHYIKEQLGADLFARYMDDYSVFGGNKRKLHKIIDAVEVYLNNNLGLTLKGNWQVFRFEYTDREGNVRGRDLDFMGYRFHNNRVTLRKKIMFRMTRKARRVGNKEKPTLYDCKQMLAALGYIKQSDVYGMYLKYIKPYVSFQYMKRRISRYDKAQYRKEHIALCGS